MAPNASPATVTDGRADPGQTDGAGGQSGPEQPEAGDRPGP